MDIITCSEWQFSFSKTVGETSQDCKDRPLISFHYSWIFPPGSGPLTSSSQLMLLASTVEYPDLPLLTYYNPHDPGAPTDLQDSHLLLPLLQLREPMRQQWHSTVGTPLSVRSLPSSLLESQEAFYSCDPLIL